MPKVFGPSYLWPMLDESPSLFFLLADLAGSQFWSLNCPRVGGWWSAAFRREVADIENQWAEKSHLSFIVEST